MFSQVPSDITGWLAAVGSIGLLGPVLYWLCYVHLPSKDRIIKELVDSKDKALEAKDVRIKELVIEFGIMMRETRAEFKDALRVLMEQHDRHITELAKIMRREFEKIGAVEQGRGGVSNA